jgi:eukaryotic-like serine/threonine-protein kinase
MEEWAPEADVWLAALADGEPVDWDAATDAARSPQQRQFVRQLQLVARIAETYRDAGSPASTASSASVDSPKTITQRAPGTRWGALEIIGLVGRGTFGDVYRARDTRLDRIVALKLLRAERRPSRSEPSEVVNEGRLLARIRHPNVAAVFGADRIDGQVGVWMELIEGRTLEDELGERGALPPEEVARIGRDLCGALAAVHDAGLLHRDVKTQNVMRDASDGRVVLMDLSAGRELTESRAGEASMPPSLAGSPAYLAPEVLRGQPGHGAKRHL